MSHDRAWRRSHVRLALGLRAWPAVILVLAGAVFALLTATDAPPRFLWAGATAGALTVGIFALLERRRTVSLALRLVREQDDLRGDGITVDGKVVRGGTFLYRYPFTTSFLVLYFQSNTALSPRVRPGARAVAIALSLLLGWWSLWGLLMTPSVLHVCLNGGETFTANEVVRRIEATHITSWRKAAIDFAKLVGGAVLVLLGLLAVSAIVVWWLE